MPISFRYILSTVFNKLLTFLGITSPSYIEKDAVDLCPGNLTAYHYLLQLVYEKYGTERMKQLLVDEVQLRKEYTSPEHEYISAKVRGADISFHLAFERFRGQKTPNDTPPAPTTEGTQTSDDTPPAPMAEGTQSCDGTPPFSQSTELPNNTQSEVGSPQSTPRRFTSKESTSSIPQSNADSIDGILGSESPIDAVSLIPRNYRSSSDSLICCLKFNRDRKPLYLYQLVVLANTIHKHKSDYLVTQSQCYFYAAAIDILLKRFENDVIFKEGLITAGKNAGKTAGTKTILQSQGRWKTIHIQSRLTQDQVNELSATNEEETKNFEKIVEDAEQQRIENKLAAERLRLAEDLARMEQEIASRELEIVRQEISALRRQLALAQGPSGQ